MKHTPVSLNGWAGRRAMGKWNCVTSYRRLEVKHVTMSEMRWRRQGCTEALSGPCLQREARPSAVPDSPAMSGAVSSPT
jgi:hypothetical protein